MSPPRPAAATVACRLALGVALGVASGVAAPRPAAAQAGTGPTLPVALDLRRVALGTWSEYTVTIAQMPPYKQRFALVARDATTCTLEMTAEGGMMAGRGRVVLKVVLDPDLSRPERVKKVVMQLGTNEPMEMQAGTGVSKDHFGQLDPKKMVGRADVKVPGGAFRTRHFRDVNASGAVDVWVSDDAPPFGIVKMEGSMPQQAGGGAAIPLRMELAGRGKGARAEVTRPARPFDPAALMNEMNRAMTAAPRDDGKNDKNDKKGK